MAVQNNPANSIAVMQKFWFAWLPLSALGFGVIYLAFFLLYHVQLKQQDGEVQAAFRLAKDHIYEEFRHVKGDFDFLLTNPLTQEVVNQPSEAARNRLEGLFLSLVKSHGRYDQMRLLTPQGQEAIRVNFNQGEPKATPADELQDKSDRYYFRRSTPLQSGQVFVSRLDLNVEKDRVELPLKPTIRFGASIPNQQRDVAAVLVINLFGDRLIDHVQRSFLGYPAHIMLLNEDGYWLYNSRDPESEWGFMKEGGERFADHYPELWQQVDARQYGTLNSEHGRLYHTTLFPPMMGVESGDNLQLKPWKLVVLDDEHAVGMAFFSRHLAYLYPLLIAYPLGTILLWYWAKASVGRQLAENQLRELNQNLEAMVDERTSELRATQQATILSLATLAETRDNETGQHIRRTQRYAKCLAERLSRHPDFAEQLNQQMIETIYQSAPLHDVGKVGIPDRILHKPGILTSDEFEVMKQHTTLGSNAIEEAITTINAHHGEGLTFLHCARDVAHYHHERWDGSGYPKGLAGEAIPLAARIMALVDVYDALVSKRVYKDAFSREKAESIILSSGGQFDPRVMEAFRAEADQFWQIRCELADPE